MISSWMGYWLAASAVIGATAAVMAWVRRLAHRPVRWVWVASILASAFAPALARGAHLVRGADAAGPVSASAASGTRAAPAKVGLGPAVHLAARSASAAPWDTLLLGAWIVASAALAARLLLVIHRLCRMRKGWRQANVDGHPVLVSPDVGPAVAGFFRKDIVLPEWALSVSIGERRLMLLHEAEHVRARDPYLLLAALVSVTLMPWNVVLWWLARRLRLAIEVDCDQRVLRQIPDVSAYGALLIEVGRRASLRRVVPLAALSDPPTFLERRISVLTTHHPRSALLTAVAVVGLAAIPAAAATIAPQPASVHPTLIVPWRTGAAAPDSVAPEALRAMRTSLRKLMTAQEMHFSDHGAYTGDVAQLSGFAVEPGVHVQFTWANDVAYVAAARDDRAPGATCVVHVGWIPRSAWLSTALEKKAGADGVIACDGDGREAHAVWEDNVPEFMKYQLHALVLPQERARGATGTYPGDASKIAGNRFDPALHFTYLWADTASWGVKAVYDSLPGKSCIVWAGSRPRKLARTDAQHRFASPGEVVCDDF